MDNIWISLAIAAAGLIAMYFYVKNFAGIDRSLFGGDDEDYQPFGTGLVYASVAIGAIMGVGVMGISIASDGDTPATRAVIYAAVMAVATLGCCGIIQTAFRMDGTMRVVGKSLVLFLSCALAFVFGFVGSVVVAVLLAIAAIIWIALQMLSSSSSSNPNKIKVGGDLIGFDETMENVGGNRYRDSSGSYWRKDGNTLYPD